MRAAVFRAPGELLTIGTVDDPRPDPGGLILRVANCGICGAPIYT